MRFKTYFDILLFLTFLTAKNTFENDEGRLKALAQLSVMQCPGSKFQSNTFPDRRVCKVNSGTLGYNFPPATQNRDIRYTSIRCLEKLWIMRCIDVFS